LVTLATPEKPVVSRLASPTVAVMLKFSMVAARTPPPSVAARVVEMLRVSVPEPPTSESPEVRVKLVALNVSSPAPPVKDEPLSTPVVSTGDEAAIAVETAA